MMALCAVIINLYLATASLSKAAMIATATSVMLFTPQLKRNELVTIGVIVIGLSPFWLEKVTQSTHYERALSRLGDIGRDHDDSLGGRGYDRIFNDPFTLLVGAGEGNYDRFNSEIHSMEIHSTFASIAFCYGLAGIVAFCVFNYRCFRIATVLYCTLFMPVFAYGITHNGIRFSFLWLLYALYLYLSEEINSSSSRLGTLRSAGNRIPNFSSYR